MLFFTKTPKRSLSHGPSYKPNPSERQTHEIESLFMSLHTHRKKTRNIHTQETGNLKEKSHQYIQNKQTKNLKEREGATNLK